MPPVRVHELVQRCLVQSGREGCAPASERRVQTSQRVTSHAQNVLSCLRLSPPMARLDHCSSPSGPASQTSGSLSLSLFSLRLYRLHAPPNPLAPALSSPEAPDTSCFLIGQFGRIDAVKSLRDWL
ncbi:unnamed protein product [Protopolystoma xenopodis]|uniref:Uncharacterized protein n=1 Tax=Protopolystoma xenopodis TaxID=117903 RepID=A0A448XQ72_9PLAT|nr:unnamed protein product [Protopolystoma xenopodis]